jgi:hypothetical protein
MAANVLFMVDTTGLIARSFNRLVARSASEGEAERTGFPSSAQGDCRPAEFGGKHFIAGRGPKVT